MSTFLKEGYLFNIISEMKKSNLEDFYRNRKHYKKLTS